MKLREQWNQARAVDGIAHPQCMHMVRIGDMILSALDEKDAAIAELVSALRVIADYEYHMPAQAAVRLIKQEARRLLARYPTK